jgi:hypothetical protein
MHCILHKDWTKKVKQIDDINYPKLIALSKLKTLQEIWEPIDDDDDDDDEDDVCIYWELQTACVHTVLSKDPTTKPNKLMM